MKSLSFLHLGILSSLCYTLFGKRSTVSSFRIRFLPSFTEIANTHPTKCENISIRPTTHPISVYDLIFILKNSYTFAKNDYALRMIRLPIQRLWLKQGAGDERNRTHPLCSVSALFGGSTHRPVYCSVEV